MMQEAIETIRVAVVAIWAVIMTALAPTANALLVLVIFAFVNAFVGYQSNWIRKRERFSFRKFWRAIVQLTFYTLLTVLLYLSFFLFGEGLMAETATKVVVWVAVWGYTVKIVQNFLEISPEMRGMRLLYNVLAVKFIPRLLERFGVEISEQDMRAMDEEMKGLNKKHDDEEQEGKGAEK